MERQREMVRASVFSQETLDEERLCCWRTAFVVGYSDRSHTGGKIEHLSQAY